MEGNMRKIGLLFGLALLLIGCAVVNVYVTFPQEKIDKAMEGLELQVQPDAPSLTAPAPKKQSRLSPWQFLEPTPLYAAETVVTSEVKTTSPAIDEAKARRRERLSDIQGYKDRKILGENNKGLLEIRVTDEALVSGVEKLVKEENSDRMIIYREIVRINSMPASDLVKVQAAAAKANRKLAKNGEWIQNEDGSWQIKSE
jgi:uncharacterized protein YdbL (DUF1318 family)